MSRLFAFAALALLGLGCGKSLHDLSPFPCATNKTCPSGFYCASNECIPQAACSANAPCDRGGFCSGGSCITDVSCQLDGTPCNSYLELPRCAWVYKQTGGGDGGPGVAEGGLQCIASQGGKAIGQHCVMNSTLGADECVPGSVCAYTGVPTTSGLCKQLCVINGASACSSAAVTLPVLCASQVENGLVTPVSLAAATGACTIPCTPLATPDGCIATYHCGIIQGQGNSYYPDCQPDGPKAEGDSCETEACASDSTAVFACMTQGVGGLHKCTRVCDHTQGDAQCKNTNFPHCTATGNIGTLGYCTP